MIKVDTSQARSNLEVVQKCLTELGWKECTCDVSNYSDIYWNAATFQDGDRDFKLNSARVNKFPKMSDIMRKVNLIRTLNTMRTLFPDHFNFYPKTWFLPQQNEQFKNDVHSIHENDRKHRRSLTTFIVKPSDGSQGNGIYLIRNPTIYSTNKLSIVQEYVNNPLLMDNFKFDIRIYVLILNLDPLQVLLYDEGLARFATIPYEAPSTTNLHCSFMHLTNTSLNKQNRDFTSISSQNKLDGIKQKLTQIWLQLTERFGSFQVQQIKRMILEMISKTVLAILPELRVQYAFEFPSDQNQNRCFQIIGFDILLTDRLKPILLEVNANPSLTIDSATTSLSSENDYEQNSIDLDIKKPLVRETLKLAMRNESCDRLETNKTFQLNKYFTNIFPTNEQSNYEHMRCLEKVGLIYIHFVVKNKQQTMNNRLFRCFAKSSGIYDHLLTLPSIDMIYTQTMFKWKQHSISPSNSGLSFAQFVEAFFEISRRKYPHSTCLFESVTHLITSCFNHLNISIEE